MNLKWSLPVLALAFAASAHAQYDRRPGLGVEVGLFMPADAEMRDIFGNSMFRWGFGPVTVAPPGTTALTPTFGLIVANRDGNRFTAIPAHLGYTMALGDRRTQTLPYARVAAGVTYLDYAITRPGAGERFSGRTISPSGSLEAGLIFGNNIRLSAQYIMLGRQDGFNFSGFQIGATFSALSF
jgi:hypothetical protein